jgi:hypothetical protein
MPYRLFEGDDLAGRLDSCPVEISGVCFHLSPSLGCFLLTYAWSIYELRVTVNIIFRFASRSRVGAFKVVYAALIAEGLPAKVALPAVGCPKYR